MGFPKNEKIEKPGYKPVISNAEEKSEFALKLETLKAKPISEKFVDIRNDIQQNRVKRGVWLYRTENPYNDIFSLTIKFGMGEVYHPLLKNATELANLSGTKDLKVKEFKNEFSKIGCTYNISSDKDYTTIELEGKDENLKKALELIYKLVQFPVADADKMNVIMEGEKSNRKIERSEPDNVANALFTWMRYNNKSSFIDRPSLKELKKLTTDSLLNVFKLATKFEAEVHYVGKLSLEEVLGDFKSSFKFPDHPTPSLAPSNLSVTKNDESIIFLVDKPKALQSKIYFMINEKPFYNDDEPVIDAFNLYFGGDFSGLVLQEVREYRSLAYSAGARYLIPSKSGRESLFYGYIGTQSDKTIEAVSLFDSLVRQMPKKADRINFIKEYLVQSAITERPDFRSLSETVASWKLHGYLYDPAVVKIPVYYELKFDDLDKFYQDNLKSKPMAIGIVGDAKRIDLKALAKYGKIVTIKEKSLFSE
jgi:predicted Zn-dependent peptidase